jgi:hypothetical protein
MKKLLMIGILALCGLMLDACRNVEYVYHTTYVYKNLSSKSLTIDSHSFMIRNGEIKSKKDSLFVIPSGEQCVILSHLGDEFRMMPFHWFSGYPLSGEDYSVVGNGENSVIQKRSQGDEIYDLKSYSISNESEHSIQFEYIFTDHFFENKEQME